MDSINPTYHNPYSYSRYRQATANHYLSRTNPQYGEKIHTILRMASEADADALLRAPGMRTKGWGEAKLLSFMAMAGIEDDFENAGRMMAEAIMQAAGGDAVLAVEMARRRRRPPFFKRKSKSSLEDLTVKNILDSTPVEETAAAISDVFLCIATLAQAEAAV